MTDRIIHRALTYLIATVWLLNGFFCKVLLLVPRHQLIVARILGEQYAATLTKAIGTAEIGMTIWIVSRITPRLNATVQIFIVAVMNILEFMLVPDLLLFGKLNSIFALLLVLVIYYNEFVLRKKLAQHV